MEKILHPISGEKGYFVSELEKRIIDIAVEDMATSTALSEGAKK